MDWLKKIISSHSDKGSSLVLNIYFNENMGSEERENKFKGKKRSNIARKKLGLIPVGTLTKKDDWFIFEYEKSCPDQYKIDTFEVDHEDRARFKYLPPFFTVRMPSRTRADLVEKFKKIGDDPLEILGKLGSRSPVSPYVFELVSEK